MAESTTTPLSPAGVQQGAAFPAGTELSPERAALWEIERELWSPQTVSATGDWGHAAALTVSRPHCAYRKIVDVIAESEAGFTAAVSAVIRDQGPGTQQHPTPIVIKFEEHTAAAPLSDGKQAALTALGFSRDPDPVPSIPSTRVGTAEHTRSWSLWLGSEPSRSVPYYGQTTDVTCGAVTALMMFEGRGTEQFGTDGDRNQSREIEFWRSATNFPACEPVALAVSTARELTATAASEVTPSVVLSAPDLVLLEWFETDADELRLRTQLQRESLRTAAALGIEIDRRWISVDEIRDLILSGNDVYLLIALAPLIGDPAPHWILAHDVIGDSIIVSDPWVEQPRGESWVDTSNLPITAEGIDLITRWGDPEYRGVIVVPHTGS